MRTIIMVRKMIANLLGLRVSYKRRDRRGRKGKINNLCVLCGLCVYRKQGVEIWSLLFGWMHG